MKLWVLITFFSLGIFCQDKVETNETTVKSSDVTGQDNEKNHEQEDDHEPEDDIEYIEDIGELQNMINRNKYVLAYFFHPSCFPCMEFVPEFDKLPERTKNLP